MAIKVKPPDLGKELRKRLGKIPRLIARGAKAGALRSKRKLVKATPVDTGLMKSSWRVVGDARTLKVLQGELPHIINDAPHAGIIEGGARPHRVNAAGREALKHWAMRVLGVDEEQAKAAVWGIVKKIEREGQEGKFIVRDMLDEMSRDLRIEVLKRIKRVANKPASRIR